MATTPKPAEKGHMIPDDHDLDLWRRQEIDINKRQERINESDDSFMQAPDLWPDPPDEDKKDG
ncbi:MAG: hypothetical protein IPG91_14175 [Ideonella sp.]|nr:hypothetical protein [Ideonella sp.]